MTLQQLEYIVALNKHRHFVLAAEHCGVTQPTLSHMVQKLETELGIRIFDRTKHPIEPTEMGKRIVRQAEITLHETRKINELVHLETDSLKGALRVGVIPTLAPYLLPEFIQKFKFEYPEIELSISEMRTASLLEELRKGQIDLMLAATPLEQEGCYEIPLYYEKFVAYFSPQNPLNDNHLAANKMPKENLWVLQEGHCVRNQIFNFCTDQPHYNQLFEAGSIDTLVRIVDKNGGYSVIPELHLPFLSDAQLKNVRPITCPPAVREISVVIAHDFLKERMVNAVAEVIKKIIPPHMLNERLKKFSIKL